MSAEKEESWTFGQKIQEAAKSFVKKHKGFTIIICIALTAWLVHSVVQTSCYKRGISMVKEGDYESAIVCFQKLDGDYQSTRGYIRLCEAMIEYENGEYLEAYQEFPFYMGIRLYPYYDLIDMDEEQIGKEYPKYALYKQLRDKVTTAAKPILQEEAERQRNAFLEELASTVPYVGLAEADIGNTMLGKPNELYDLKPRRLYVWTSYGNTIFFVYCEKGEVTEVRDHRRYPIIRNANSTSSRPRASSTPNPYPGDIYGIGSIRDAEELYEEYPDDFESIDEAEEYFNAYRK